MKMNALFIASLVLVLAMPFSAHAEPASASGMGIIGYPDYPGPSLPSLGIYPPHNANNAGSPVVFMMNTIPAKKARYSVYFGDGTVRYGIMPHDGHLRVEHTYNSANYHGYFVYFKVHYLDGTEFATMRNVPVWLAGDANGDGVVDKKDAKIVKDHIGSIYGDENYNDGADLNNDRVVDKKDLRIVKANR